MVFILPTTFHGLVGVDLIMKFCIQLLANLSKFLRGVGFFRKTLWLDISKLVG